RRRRGNNGKAGIRSGRPEGRRRGTAENQGGQLVRQARGPGRTACAPRRTAEDDHLGALGTLSQGGSLQPPIPGSGTPSPRYRGRAILRAGRGSFGSA